MPWYSPGFTMAQSSAERQPPVSIRIPRPLLEFVDREASASFRSRNAYIKDLIAKEYARHKETVA